jgi:hypothetical protein
MAFLGAVIRNDVDAAATTRRVIEEYVLRSKRRAWKAARAGIANEERATG